MKHPKNLCDAIRTMTIDQLKDEGIVRDDRRPKEANFHKNVQYGTPWTEKTLRMDQEPLKQNKTMNSTGKTSNDS